MTKHSWVLGVLLSFFLLIPLAIAVPDGTGIITVNGTNVSGAQSNVTVVDTNNTYSVTAWNIGNGIKTFTIHVFNSSDTIYFNLYNNTPGMIYELRVNGTAKQGYQADSLGLVTFRYVQPNGNRSYDIRPATVVGGQNFTWSWFKDIIIKNGTIENVWMTNVTQVNVNVTTLNATEITGNGSRINGINISNATFGELQDHLLSGNVLLGSNTSVLRDNNISILLDSNNSIIPKQKVDSCTAANDALGWNNTGFNCKTITASAATNSSIKISANITLFNGTYYANASSGELVLTLPNAAAGGSNIITVVYLSSRNQYEYGGTNYTNNLSVVSTLGQNISGKPYYNFTAVADSATFVSESGNWSVIETNGCANCLRVQASLAAQGSATGAFNGADNGGQIIAKTITVGNGGITGTWSIRFGSGTEQATLPHYTRVYLNFKPIGKLWQTSTVWTTDYDNVNELFNIPLRTGDKIQIWSYQPGVATGRFRDFNISFTNLNTTSFTIS